MPKRGKEYEAAAARYGIESAADDSGEEEEGGGVQGQELGVPETLFACQAPRWIRSTERDVGHSQHVIRPLMWTYRGDRCVPNFIRNKQRYLPLS